MEQPPPPEELDHLVDWLSTLPSPLSWGELSAWAAMTGRNPARWELEALMRLDRIRQ